MQPTRMVVGSEGLPRALAQARRWDDNCYSRGWMCTLDKMMAGHFAPGQIAGYSLQRIDVHIG